MNVQYLSAQNFVILGKQQKSLGINLGGNVLVFCKMQKCENCEKFEPIFYQLPLKNNKVTYAIIDISQYREVIEMSRGTNTPIQAVPLLILFINGRPHAKFNGTIHIQSIDNFINKALANAPPEYNTTGYQPHQSQQQQQAQYNTGISQGHSGFNPQIEGRYTTPPPGVPGSNKVYMPDIGKSPSLHGIVKGAKPNFNQVEDDDENKMLIPDSITPYNTPWENYKMLNEE